MNRLPRAAHLWVAVGAFAGSWFFMHDGVMWLLCAGLCACATWLYTVPYREHPPEKNEESYL